MRIDFGVVFWFGGVFLGVFFFFFFLCEAAVLCCDSL